jgi:FdhE protein
MGDNPPFALENFQPLVPEVSPRPSYAQRIQRARDLSEHYRGAAEFLRFYERLAFCQQHIFESLSSVSEKTAPGVSGEGRNNDEHTSSRWSLRLDKLTPLFPDFLRALAAISPSAMRDRAGHFAATDPVQQAELLTRFWNGGFDQDSALSQEPTLLDRFIALAFLQPYAEWLAQAGHGTMAVTRHATCPACFSEPLCAVLREQDHGARRGLVCSLCMSEWNFPRLVCPSCGEQRFELLPVFTPAEVPHVRVDACDTCRHYIKTVDLTKDGLAIPIVDELAAVSLDLWAREQGYVKLVLNLAGL